MKKFFTTLILALFAVTPSITSAAFDDATLTTDVVINVAGINLNVYGSSAVIESITVNADNFSFVLQPGSSIQVASPDRRVLSTTAANQYITINTCDSSGSVLKHSLSGSGSVVITITPQSYICVGSATSATAGGGGIIPGTLNKPTGSFSVVVNNGADITKTKEVALTFKIGSSVSKMAISSHMADLSDAAIIDYKPTVTWDLCSKFGGLVKLSDDQCAEGVYTIYVRFYTQYGQSSETFSDTIEYKKSGIGATAQLSIATGTGRFFTRMLVFKSRSEDVRRLQQILNRDLDTHLANAGAGSPGNETDYFGVLTEKAVQKFQIKYGIVSSGTPQTSGFGLVGPKTRAKLNEILTQ